MEDEVLGEFPLHAVQAPATLANLLRHTGGPSRKSGIGSTALFARIMQMQNALNEGDMEQFREVKQTALMEQGALMAVDALNGSPAAMKDMLMALAGNGTAARRLKGKAGLAVAGLAALASL